MGSCDGYNGGVYPVTPCCTRCGVVNTIRGAAMSIKPLTLAHAVEEKDNVPVVRDRRLTKRMVM